MTLYDHEPPMSVRPRKNESAARHFLGENGSAVVSIWLESASLSSEKDGSEVDDVA